MPGVMFGFDLDMVGVIVFKDYSGEYLHQLVMVVVCNLNFFIKEGKFKMLCLLST